MMQATWQRCDSRQPLQAAIGNASLRDVARPQHVANRIGALIGDECGSLAGYNMSGSAISVSLVFAVGRLVDMPFRFSRGVVCRGLHWPLVPCGLVGCVYWVVCELGCSGRRVRAVVALHALCRLLLMIVVLQQL
jgi:hypothetical protein